ncbi:MAG TPA: hypothetical protein VFB60_11820 [Ktedonobacteraceae bacterium]|nr:hypothetical protein [Ktedonobacteraceae bacterium]
MQSSETAAYLPAAIIATTLEERYQQCAWCWQKRHPDKPYPRAWSSTICPECLAEVEAEAARIKAERAIRKAQAASLSLAGAMLESTAATLCGKRRRLAHIAILYRDQLTLLPVQVQATMEHLTTLRRLVNAACASIRRLDPEAMAHIRPGAVITRLESVEELLTETLLQVEMFRCVYQSLSPERVRIHMDIRAAFPPLLTAYDDTVSQLSALAQKARQTEKGE